MEECVQRGIWNDASAIVLAIAQGDCKSEENLILQYRWSLVILLERLCGDKARAEDLAHETLIIILKKLRGDGLDEPGKLASYVSQTARFVYLGWLRKAGNQVELLGGLDDFGCHEAVPENECIGDEKHKFLCQSIEGLPVRRDREILFRHYIDEQSKPEICDALVLSDQHFDRVIYRARVRLRERVERDSELLACC